jgi:hypothetical protein
MMEPISVNNGPERRQYLGRYLMRFVKFAPPRKACPPTQAAAVVGEWDDLVAVMYGGVGIDAVLRPLAGDMSRVGYLPDYPDFGQIDLLCGLGEALLEVGRLDEAEAALDHCLAHGKDACRDSTWRRLEGLRERIITPRDQLVHGSILEKIMMALPATKYSAIASSIGHGEDATKRAMARLKRMGLVSGARGHGYKLTPQGTLELQRVGRPSKP